MPSPTEIHEKAADLRRRATRREWAAMFAASFGDVTGCAALLDAARADDRHADELERANLMFDWQKWWEQVERLWKGGQRPAPVPA